MKRNRHYLAWALGGSYMSRSATCYLSVIGAGDVAAGVACSFVDVWFWVLMST